MLKEHYISNPKPIYIESNPKKGSKRFKMGTHETGIIIDINKKGIKLNGYYSGKNMMFSIFCEPIFIPWDEFEKIKNTVSKSRKRHKQPSDEILKQEYFDTLPIIELSGRKFYVDSKRQERREVSNPHKVIKF